MSDTPAAAGSPVPQIVGRLGLYATYVAAALFTLVLAGDLDVLVRRPPVVGGLALLVGLGPLAALLLSTLASYINYFGVWRIARGKDEFDAGQDLKSHAADLPQAAQALLAKRGGCLPVASIALLMASLLLALTTTLPPTTPFLGVLGDWHTSPSARQAAAPAVTPTLTVPPATPTLTVPPATPTPTKKPPATATPTNAPPVVSFSIAPQQASWDCHNQGQLVAAQTITLDNHGSTVAVRWTATVVERETNPNGSPGNPWATVSASSGTDPAGGKQTITVTPDSAVCFSSSATGTPWHVRIATDDAGTYTFTYTIKYYLT